MDYSRTRQREVESVKEQGRTVLALLFKAVFPSNLIINLSGFKPCDVAMECRTTTVEVVLYRPALTLVATAEAVAVRIAVIEFPSII